MISKLWCWLFGHKINKSKSVIYDKPHVINDKYGSAIIKGYYILGDYCPRCGKKL